MISMGCGTTFSYSYLPKIIVLCSFRSVTVLQTRNRCSMWENRRKLIRLGDPSTTEMRTTACNTDLFAAYHVGNNSARPSMPRAAGVLTRSHLDLSLAPGTRAIHTPWLGSRNTSLIIGPALVGLQSSIQSHRLFWIKVPVILHFQTLNCRQNQEKGLPKAGYGDNRIPQPNRHERPLQLMDFKERIWPHPLKSLRNVFFAMIIRGYFDPSFSMQSFLDGAQQAVVCVSSLISEGKFGDMEGLVSREAVGEIKHNYKLLSPRQQRTLVVDPRDIFLRFIYEIGIIFDDETDRRFVEITAVFQSIPGSNQGGHNIDSEKLKAETMQIFNYRFVREYTKGHIDKHDWIINKLNHFMPKDIVEKTNIFRR